MPKFKPPTLEESNDFIKQTKCILTNDLLVYLKQKPRQDKKFVTYDGTLSLAQQMHIINEQSNDNINFKPITRSQTKQALALKQANIIYNIDNDTNGTNDGKYPKLLFKDFVFES